MRLTQALLTRAMLSFAVFFVIWFLLAVVGTVLVDTEAVQKSLGESDWLKFLQPTMRNDLLRWGWQPLAALIVAFLSYGFLEEPAAYLAPIIFRIKPVYDLTDDAKVVLRSLWKENLLRRPEQIATELGISVERVMEALNQLQLNGLARERYRRRGIFWDKTYAGRDYLNRLSLSSSRETDSP